VSPRLSTEPPERAEPPLFPIAVRLENVPCLVVGGGRVAARKTGSLLECGAEVTVVAPRPCPEIEAMPVTLIRREYEAGEVANYRLVIAATGLSDVDGAVFRDGETAGVMVNAADDMASCRYFLPSVLRRGPVTVAVSTAGKSPFLASWLRRRLADVVGPEFSQLANLLGAARRELKEAGLSTEAADWSSLLDDDLLSALAAGRDLEARGRVARWLCAQKQKIASSADEPGT
jgi:precorrin-2 dehydrogenase/sirohydrochlorin ferrochelatase